MELCNLCIEWSLPSFDGGGEVMEVQILGTEQAIGQPRLGSQIPSRP
jgi:hypothetical protein